jgi:hypothetical protein
MKRGCRRRPRGAVQQDREGDGPAFVEGSQIEKHENSKCVQQGRLGPALPLLVGEAGPVEPEPPRQLRGEAPPWPAWPRRSCAPAPARPDIHRGKAVEAFQPGRAAGPAAGGEGRRTAPSSRPCCARRAFPGPGQHPVGGVRLHVHPLDAPAVDEVVDVGAAEGAEMALWMALIGTPRAPALSQSTSIRYWGTSSMPLGGPSSASGPAPPCREAGCGPPSGLHARCRRGPAAGSRTPWALAQFTTAGGGKANTLAPRIGQTGHGPPRGRLGPQVRAVALSQSFSLTKTMPLFCARPEKAHAGNGHARFHRLLFVLQEMPLDVGCNRLGLLQGRAGRHEDLGQQDPLVLVRQVAVGMRRKRTPQPPTIRAKAMR